MSPIAEGTAALVAGEIGGDAAGRGKDVVPPRASMVERREAPQGGARRRNGARRAALWSARALSQSARRLPALHFPRP